MIPSNAFQWNIIIAFTEWVIMFSYCQVTWLMSSKRNGEYMDAVVRIIDSLKGFIKTGKTIMLNGIVLWDITSFYITGI